MEDRNGFGDEGEGEEAEEDEEGGWEMEVSGWHDPRKLCMLINVIREDQRPWLIATEPQRKHCSIDASSCDLGPSGLVRKVVHASGHDEPYMTDILPAEDEPSGQARAFWTSLTFCRLCVGH